MDKANILNFAGRQFEHVPVLQDSKAVAVVLDKNSINKLENLKFYPLLEQVGHLSYGIYYIIC